MENTQDIQQDIDKEQQAQRQALQKQFRTIGLGVFLMCLGLAVLRLSITSLGLLGVDLNVGDGFVVDAIFSVLMQVGLLVVLPFCLYKFVLKKSAKQVLQFSHIQKTSLVNIVIAVLLGVCCFVTTIGVSLLWNILLGALGYTHSSSSTQTGTVLGGAGVFISLLLVGVLPGFCEEFALRGGFLNNLYSTYGKKTAIIVGAITFGLFHQNIQQLFFTAVTGILLVHITILTKSIWPAVIIHFANNSISTYLDYARQYNWIGLDFFETVQKNFGVAFLVYLFVVGFGVVLIVLLNSMNSNKAKLKKNTQGLMVNFATVAPVVVPSSVLSSTPDTQNQDQKMSYKPTLSDYTFYFGAFVITVLATVFTYMWGL